MRNTFPARLRRIVCTSIKLHCSDIHSVLYNLISHNIFTDFSFERKSSAINDTKSEFDLLRFMWNTFFLPITNIHFMLLNVLISVFLISDILKIGTKIMVNHSISGTRSWPNCSVANMLTHYITSVTKYIFQCQLSQSNKHMNIFHFKIL